MKNICLFVLGLLGATLTFGDEGDVGTQAYFWTGYKSLDSVTYPNPAGLSLTSFRGKAILLDVFMYTCGGCMANAPAIGALADSLGSGNPSIPFQAVGTEIANATFSDIQVQYNAKLLSKAPKVKFPLVRVPFDTAITTISGLATVWHRYNSFRDVYFVIDHNGKITARIEGDTRSKMTTTQYASLRTALIAAIAQVPTGIVIRPREKTELHKNAVTWKIMDLQGRTLRTWSKGANSVLYFPRL